MRETSAWIWGRHPVLEAIRAGAVRSVLVAAGRHPGGTMAEIRSLAAERGVMVRVVPPPRLERMAPGQTTQGVMAEVVERRLTDVEELLRTVAQADRQPFLLALDQVQDPYNLGSLLRTAHAAGAQGVIVPERRSAPVSGVVAKASAGAVSHLPILEVTNLARTLEALKKGGIWIVGLDGSAQEPIYGVDLTVPVALVVGGEGAGLRRLTREHCDLLLYIPMFGKVASLNAAVAGAIGMYELVRQRTTFAT